MKKIFINFLFFILLFVGASSQVVFAETYPELCAVFNRTLKPGDTGVDVKRLQIVLGQEGIAYLSATGYYGSATERAVKVFQQRNGIYPAGRVGPQTYRFMQNMWCTGNVPSPINPNNVYIPINTNNPELPSTGWVTGGSNWNNTAVPEVSLQPVSSLNNSITISWNTRSVTSCTLQKDNENVLPVLPSGQQIFTLYGESRFTLKCTGFNGREYSKQIIVRPNQAISNLPYVNVSITPTQVLVGQSATLYWTSQNTAYCTSNIAGYNTNQPTSGSIPVTISSGTNSFTFTCYNYAGQSVSQTITANSNQVLTPTINNFTYSNNYLAWGTSNTNVCTLSGGNLPITNVQTNGNQYVVTPSVNTTWTLNCIGNNNQSVTRQVNYNVSVNPNPTGYITADATTDAQQYRGQNGTVFNFYCPANLALSTIWGTNVYSDDSSVCTAAIHAGKITQSAGGYVSVKIGGASNSFESTTRNGVTSTAYGYWLGTFTIENTTITNTPIINSFTANPSSIYPGQSAVLSWNAPNFTSCRFDNEPAVSSGWATNTNRTVSPTQTTTYILTCSGPNGERSAQVTVGVYASSAQVPTVNISASPNPVSSGQLTNLSWYSTNASYCNISGGNTNITNQPANGNYAVSPAQSTNYTITCYNNNGQNASAYVYVTTNGNQSGNYPITLQQKNSGYVVVSVQNYCNITGSIDWGDNTPRYALMQHVCGGSGTFAHQYYNYGNSSQSYTIVVRDANNNQISSLVVYPFN